jgi:hypothetical protein
VRETPGDTAVRAQLIYQPMRAPTVDVRILPS